MEPIPDLVRNRQEFFDRVEKASAHLRSRLTGDARVAIVLGSGLRPDEGRIEIRGRCSYEAVPGLSATTVEGHRGEILDVLWNGVPALILAGRSHYYEHGSIENTLVQGAVLAALDVGVLILTNAAGALEPDYRPGDLMAIEDHIDFQFARGPWPVSREGFPRVHGRRTYYDRTILDLVRRAALESNVPLHVGVLMAASGPCYETPAEIRMARLAGAQAATMSTVPEARGADFWGLRVGGISTISNVHRLTGGGEQVHHEEVLEAGYLSSRRLNRLLHALLPRLEAL